MDGALAAESLIEGANPLTAREQDVLRVALAGAPISVVARGVHLSEGTVRNYLSSAAAKLGAANRHEAARLARRVASEAVGHGLGEIGAGAGPVHALGAVLTLPQEDSS